MTQTISQDTVALHSWLNTGGGVKRTDRIYSVRYAISAFAWARI